MTTVRGSLRLRGGVWEAVLRGVPGRGKATRSTRFPEAQRGEAEACLRAMLEELNAEPAAADGGLTFQAWGEKWLEERDKRGVLSAVNERAHLRYHAFPALGAEPIASLTKARMLEWVRSLPAQRCVGSEQTLSSRTVHHVAGTVRRLLAEAVDRELLAVNPCTWRTKRDLPPKRDKVAGKRNRSGFASEEVHALLTDPRVPLDRRVMYAIDFLTGMRPGEVAARRWRDLDTTTAPLWRIDVATAYNSRHAVLKSTKTNVEKVVPVHPLLQELLRLWYGGGWRDFMGREPTPDDLVVPREEGGHRTDTHSNKRFKSDLERLGLRGGRTHYETRSTFRSLAIGGGAPREALDLITHPSPREASDLYTRIDQVWPAMCAAVVAVKVEPRSADAASPAGGVARGVAVSDPEKEKARRLAGFGPLPVVGAEGFESPREGAQERSEGPAGGASPAQARPAALTAALARAAAAAAEAGELDQARELLDQAARTLPPVRSSAVASVRAAG